MSVIDLKALVKALKNSKSVSYHKIGDQTLISDSYFMTLIDTKSLPEVLVKVGLPLPVGDEPNCVYRKISRNWCTGPDLKHLWTQAYKTESVLCDTNLTFQYVADRDSKPANTKIYAHKLNYCGLQDYYTAMFPEGAELWYILDHTLVAAILGNQTIGLISPVRVENQYLKPIAD